MNINNKNNNKKPKRNPIMSYYYKSTSMSKLWKTDMCWGGKEQDFSSVAGEM
jgi:hypothetical protein